MHAPLPDDPLVQRVAASVQTHMSTNDASHSFDHVLRVVGLSLHLLAHHPPPPTPPLDPLVVVLAALTHDVGDRKYQASGTASTTAVHAMLLAHGASDALASRVQAVVAGVSYSAEMADPLANGAVLARHAELGVVQDADRLDAMGAVGIGRMFTFGGARTAASMEEPMRHMDEKLLRLECIMKTARGREMARERTARMEEFKRAWREEVEFAELVKGALGSGQHR